MRIRNATASDVAFVIDLFRQAVLRATASEYSEQQRQAWAARGNDPARWERRIATQHFLVAEQQSQLAGFGAITLEGHLDVLYVHPAHQRQGIATRLLTALERWAEEQEFAKITVDVSITARPFFARYGYQVLTEQQNKIGEEVLINYRMQKLL